MKEKKMDKKDIYILVLISLFYLYLYCIKIDAASYAYDGNWLFFITLPVVASGICVFAWFVSCPVVNKVIKYFGLQRNYLVLTILSLITAPLTIIVLYLLFSGAIPSIFDPQFL